MSALPVLKNGASVVSLQDRGTASAAALRRVMKTADDMLSIYRMVEEFDEKHRGAARYWTANLPETLWKPPHPEVVRSEDSRGERARRELGMIADRLPPLAALRCMRDAIRAFEAEPPKPAQNRLLIALYVDRFPNGRPHSPITYVEGLIAQADRGGYSPTQVARACDVLLTTSNFLAAPAEFQAALEAAKFPGISTRTLERAISVIEQIQTLLTIPASEER